MKKVFLVLMVFLFSFSNSYSQNNIGNALILNSRVEQMKEEGISYLGQSEYLVVEIGNTGFTGMKRIIKDATKKLEDFAKQSNAEYEIIHSEEFKSVVPLPKIKITFRLLNKDGSSILKKDEVTQRLLDLKKLLVAGVITQEEFDKSAAPLKKMLLGKD